MNLNRVFLIGRLTADPQLRTTPGGQSVATFGVATNRVWNDKQGQRHEDVQFHNIVVWGRQAETTNQFLKKGAIVFVEGRIQTRSWQDKQGQARTTTEIISERIQFGPRAGGSGSGNQGGSRNQSEKNSSSSDGVDEIKEELPAIDIDGDEVRPEDIPF